MEKLACQSLLGVEVLIDNTKTLSIWAFLNENKRIEIRLWSTYCFSCRITKSNPTVMMTFPYVAQTSAPPPTIVPLRTALIRMIRLHDQTYPLPGWIIYRLYLWLFLIMAASVNVIFSSFVIDGNKFVYYRFFVYSLLLLIMENTLCLYRYKTTQLTGFDLTKYETTVVTKRLIIKLSASHISYVSPIKCPF